MKKPKRLLMLLALAAAFTASGAFADKRNNDIGDVLYIGDAGVIDDYHDDTVKAIDVKTGKFLGNFVAPGSGGLNGPRGLIFLDDQLLVVNQNVDQPYPGEVLGYDARTGKFEKKIVALDNPNAPFAPRGLIRGEDHRILVADIGTAGDKCSNEGRIAEYDAETGKFLGNFDRKGFTAPFHPRGLVMGADGLLYVSAIGCPIPDDPDFDPLAGYILRFNPKARTFVDVFASCTKENTNCHLHRPEGLAFDPKGNLWVTSFRANASDTDRIMKLQRKTGAYLESESLVLAKPEAEGGKRAAAQAILFGPDGDLFVPIQNGHPEVRGELLRCSEGRQGMRCDIVLPPTSAGGPLQTPWYLTFGKTDPSTLSYRDDRSD